ncbi:hypothetical protein CYG49_05085 [Candidatus Saccharibacteria bacterium]|nr:MAG: hypothetical protein CYG49_05085 [Candidatus Saccharibacteria bacterium]
MLDQQSSNVVFAYVDQGPHGGLYELYVNTTLTEETTSTPTTHHQAFSGELVPIEQVIYYIEGKRAVRRSA